MSPGTSGFLKYAVREEINRSASRGPSKISLACSSSRKLSSAKQPYCVFPKCLTRVVLPIWRAPVTIKAFFVGEFFHLASSSHIFRLSIKASSPDPSRFSLFFRTVCHVFRRFDASFVTFFQKRAKRERCTAAGNAKPLKPQALVRNSAEGDVPHPFLFTVRGRRKAERVHLRVLLLERGKAPGTQVFFRLCPCF